MYHLGNVYVHVSCCPGYGYGLGLALVMVWIFRLWLGWV